MSVANKAETSARREETPASSENLKIYEMMYQTLNSGGPQLKLRKPKQTFTKFRRGQQRLKKLILNRSLINKQ